MFFILIFKHNSFVFTTTPSKQNSSQVGRARGFSEAPGGSKNPKGVSCNAAPPRVSQFDKECVGSLHGKRGYLPVTFQARKIGGLV